MPVRLLKDFNYSEIKNRIKEIRKTKNITQDVIAKKMGISYTTYSDFENMIRPTVMKYVNDFAKAMELDPNWVLYGEDRTITEEDKNKLISHDIEKISLDEQMTIIYSRLKDDKTLRVIIIKLLDYIQSIKER